VKTLILIAFLISFVGCSTGIVDKQRNPAQVDDCSDGLSELVTQDHKLWRSYKLQDYEGLTLSFLEESPELQKLVDLHAFEEQREHSRLIMALIKRNYPEYDASLIARRYARLYKECSAP
jgi:antirestriction protein